MRMLKRLGGNPANAGLFWGSVLAVHSLLKGASAKIMDQSQVIKLPTPGFTHPGVTSSRGIPKGTITLILSVVAVIISLAGAYVSYFRWDTGERALAETMAGQAHREAMVNRILDELEKQKDSHPALRSEIHNLQANLDYSPPPGSLSPFELLAFGVFVKDYVNPIKERDKITAEKTLAVEATGNQHQDKIKKGVETREAQGRAVSAEVKARLDKQVVDPLIPALGRSTQRGINGDLMMLGLPAPSPSRLGGRASVPDGRWAPTDVDPFAKRPSRNIDPFPKRSTIDALDIDK